MQAMEDRFGSFGSMRNLRLGPNGKNGVEAAHEWLGHFIVPFKKEKV